MFLVPPLEKYKSSSATFGFVLFRLAVAWVRDEELSKLLVVGRVT